MATTLLSPFIGIRLAWAITGKFSNDETSKVSATVAEQALKSIRTEAAKDPKEGQYVAQSEAAIEASMRSLEIIHKGRELNFEENKKLRDAYMETVKENIEFGNKAQDFLKSLPTMAITGAGATITFGGYLASRIGVPEASTTAFLWALGVAMAGVGYLIHMGVVRAMRRRTQMLLVQQDYDRNLYYEQYMSRVAMTLTSLYLDLDRIHQVVFGAPYPVSDGKHNRHR